MRSVFLTCLLGLATTQEEPRPTMLYTATPTEFREDYNYYGEMATTTSMRDYDYSYTTAAPTFESEELPVAQPTREEYVYYTTAEEPMFYT